MNKLQLKVGKIMESNWNNKLVSIAAIYKLTYRLMLILCKNPIDFSKWHNSYHFDLWKYQLCLYFMSLVTYTNFFLWYLDEKKIDKTKKCVFLILTKATLKAELNSPLCLFYIDFSLLLIVRLPFYKFFIGKMNYK